jgi:hypothetical protein
MEVPARRKKFPPTTREEGQTSWGLQVPDLRERME